MKNELIKTKSRILAYYAFKEDKEGNLSCMLEDGLELFFRFSCIGNEVDLHLKGIHPPKEESLALSFSFDNKEDIEILNEWYLKRKK